jgi:hypothetical protein
MDTRECQKISENVIVPWNADNVASLSYRFLSRCSIQKKVLGWECRMQETLTDMEDLSAI